MKGKSSEKYVLLLLCRGTGLRGGYTATRNEQMKKGTHHPAFLLSTDLVSLFPLRNMPNDSAQSLAEVANNE
jgi:hypothetical protein